MEKNRHLLTQYCIQGSRGSLHERREYQFFFPLANVNLMIPKPITVSLHFASVFFSASKIPNITKIKEYKPTEIVYQHMRVIIGST